MAKTLAQLSAYSDILSDRLDAMRADLETLRAENRRSAEQLHASREELVRVREELGHTRRQLDEERASGREQDRTITELQKQNALLGQRLDEHIKRVELWDTRRWGLILMLIGAVLSLASGLIVTLARK